MTSTIIVRGLKPGADVEYSVESNGQTTLSRTVATDVDKPRTAPGMQPGCLVRVRQGECDHWSDWSNSQTPFEFGPLHKPNIFGNLFDCQNVVTVHDIFPLAGTITVVSNRSGPISNPEPVTGDQMYIRVAPALSQDHEITAVHQACGQVQVSDPKTVLLTGGLHYGAILDPLYDGDTSMTVVNVSAGVDIELWDQADPLKPIASGQAPSSESGIVSVIFKGVKPLLFDHHIYGMIRFCGDYSRMEGATTVEYRPPILAELIPNAVEEGKGDLHLTARGQFFREGFNI